jgi:rfaE bifunctional protein nucleotidyltransferase chain/domain
MAGKLIKLAELKRLRRKWRREKKRVVFTNGCFDLLHPGHVRYLSKARSFGDLLVVGLNSDRSVRRLKGASRPVMDQASRAEILCALWFVDYVVIFEEDTPLKLIEEIEPEVLVKGADWPLSRIVGAEQVLKSGGEVRRVRLARGYSTSALVRKILQKGFSGNRQSSVRVVKQV